MAEQEKLNRKEEKKEYNTLQIVCLVAAVVAFFVLIFQIVHDGLIVVPLALTIILVIACFKLE